MKLYRLVLLLATITTSSNITLEGRGGKKQERFVQVYRLLLSLATVTTSTTTTCIEKPTVTTSTTTTYIEIRTCILSSIIILYGPHRNIHQAISIQVVYDT